MSILRLKYINTYRDRHGRLRRYFRRPGCRSFPLRGDPGSPEFNADYSAAWEATAKSGPVAVPIGAKRTKAGSVAALIAHYLASHAFTSMATTTRTTYRGIYDRFRLEHGDDSVAGLRAKHVKAIIQKKAARGAPHAANNLLKCIRLLMRYAVELEWRDDDPTMGVRNIKTASLGFHTWSEDEIAAYEKRWEVGTRERQAFALALYTGQRRGDIVRMGRQHVRDGFIEVRQQKTGVALAIPLHSALKAILDAAPKDNLTFLTNRYGKPFSPAGFTGWFRECAEAAGLPTGCAVHGLRKAAARRLAEAGCTAHQIAAITGHRTLKEVQRYTSAADQKRLAQDAIAALQRPAFKRKANKARATVRKLPNRKALLVNSGE